MQMVIYGIGSIELYEPPRLQLRASTMELSIFEYLNGSHMYTSFIYNFLIIVPNKYSIPPTQHPLKNSKWVSQITHFTNNYTSL
jgi:hypothetical protein